MRKNVASQVVCAQLNATADGSAVTTGTTTVYVLGDGGTQGSGSGTVTHEGQGCWSYVPTQAETNYNHVAYTFVNSSAIAQTINVYPQVYDGTSGYLSVDVAGISGDTTAATNAESFFDGTGYAGTNNVIPTVTTVTSVTNDVGVNEWNGVALGTTNPLPNAAAGAAGGLPTDSTGKTSFNDVSTAEVNAEVSDVIKTDTITLAGQSTPSQTPTLEDAIALIYKFMVNKKTSTSTTISVFNADESTVDHKSTISDNGTTYTEGEWTTGP